MGSPTNEAILGAGAIALGVAHSVVAICERPTEEVVAQHAERQIQHVLHAYGFGAGALHATHGELHSKSAQLSSLWLRKNPHNSQRFMRHCAVAKVVGNTSANPSCIMNTRKPSPSTKYVFRPCSI